MLVEVRSLLLSALVVVGLARQVVALESEHKEDPQLAAVVEKVMLAYGGRDSLIRLDGNCVLRGHEKVFPDTGGEAKEMTFQQVRKGAKLRIDLAGGGNGAASSTTVFDGSAGWKAGGRWVSDLPAEAVKVLREDRDRQPGVFAQFGQPGYTFQFLGRTTYKQVPVFSVQVAHGEHSPTAFFVDQNNFLVVGSNYSFLDSDTNAKVSVDTDYSEYRPVDGAMVPFKQTQTVNGKDSLVLALDGADLARSIDDALFRRPSQGGAVRLEKPVAVPIAYTQGELIVKVRLNGGEPVDFLIDTGASESMVDRRIAAEHFLDKQGQVEISGASGTVTTNTSVIKKLELGNLQLEDVHALILDLSPQSRQIGRPIGGIIGANVLSQFVVTLDFSRQSVTFTDPAAYQVPAGSTCVPFTQKPGLLVRASLNGRDEETFLLDTGAAFNHLPAAVARKYVQGQAQHLTEGTGLDGRPVRLGTLVIDTVLIGKQPVGKVNFTYPADGEANKARGGFFQTASTGILGNPFWQNFILSIDYRSQKLILQLAAARKAAGDAEKDITTGDTRLVINRDYRGAEIAYQKALFDAQSAADRKSEAKALGRLGNLHRVMAHDLSRPDQAKVAYQYFNRAQQLSRSIADREVEGRILADWSLLYSDNNQSALAGQTMQAGLLLAPNDPYVNVDSAVHLYRAKLYGDMQKYVDKALFLDPSNWQALWYQVKLSEMFLDTGKQMSTLKEILRFYPGSKLAHEKLNALTNPVPVPNVPATQGAPGADHM